MFVLAERLGMTVGELRWRMPQRELYQWMAFDSWRNDEREWAEKKAAL